MVAETNKQAMQDLPEHVRFHYTGNPDREVFIEGEEQPLWMALFLWVVSAGIVAFWIVPLFWRQPASVAHIVSDITAGNDASNASSGAATN